MSSFAGDVHDLKRERTTAAIGLLDVSRSRISGVVTQLRNLANKGEMKASPVSLVSELRSAVEDILRGGDEIDRL